jgi:thiamine-phosphate pyrophosphorylase
VVERLIDANLDRIGEGLRVLEDIARFSLNDIELCKQLKTWRHELVGNSWQLEQKLLTARKVDEDVAQDIEVPGEEQRQHLPALVVANATRVQQSLRVIEEFAKLPSVSPTLDSVKFKQARFALYKLEQDLVAKLVHKEKVAQLAGIYLILDTQALKGRNERDVALQAIRGGAKVIQLRDKQGDKRELLERAQKLKAVCAAEGALFIINDWLDLTLAADADGVHLGQRDLPVWEARHLLPSDKLIGCSTSTLAEALQAQSDGADYIAVGALYSISSKEDVRLVERGILPQIRQAISLPVIAIGGINQANVEEVIKGGADGIAVISAILEAEDIKGATHKLAAKLEQVKLQVKSKSEEFNNP